jgi:hypothetical protein
MDQERGGVSGTTPPPVPAAATLPATHPLASLLFQHSLLPSLALSSKKYDREIFTLDADQDHKVNGGLIFTLSYKTILSISVSHTTHQTWQNR